MNARKPMSLPYNISIIPNSETVMTPKAKVIKAIQEYRAVPGIEQATHLEQLLDYYLASDTPSALVLGDGSVVAVNGAGDVPSSQEGTIALYKLEVDRSAP